MQRTRIVRPLLQNLTQHAFRLRKPPRVCVRGSKLQRLCNAHRPRIGHGAPA
jgi:hypothetical protein